MRNCIQYIHTVSSKLQEEQFTKLSPGQNKKSGEMTVSREHIPSIIDNLINGVYHNVMNVIKGGYLI